MTICHQMQQTMNWSCSLQSAILVADDGVKRNMEDELNPYEKTSIFSQNLQGRAKD